MKFIKKTSGMLGAATLTLASLLLVAPAMAQNDPPGRVARVGYSYGQINFADAGSNQWTELIPNRPISTGDSIFVAEQGRAELHVGNSALRLNENTRLSFINLTDDVSQIQLTQGTIVVRVRALSEREVFEINTPNLNFGIQEPGEYRININPDNTTTVVVRRGVGVAQGDRDVITLREGEQTRFSGTNLNHTMIARAPAFDTFDQWAYDRDRAEENSVSARYVPRDMVGYQQLDEYGNWETHVEYGAIWYPRGISAGWAPYRDGRWVWVAPWGWTWVDRSPWGFAPYHYGRWAYVGRRWGWVPGRYEHHHRPVYAPALVAFVGATNHGVSVGVSVGSRHVSGPAVSWYPLGPGESYRPHYTQNPRYIQNINQTIINNTVVINRGKGVYVNRDVPNSVTSVPSQTFVRGEHVFPASKSILTNQIKKLEVLNEGPNLTPANNNRFGEGRPRTWQENDQYHSRATINSVNNNSQGSTNNNFDNRGRDRTNTANGMTNNRSGVTTQTPNGGTAGLNVQTNPNTPVGSNAPSAQPNIVVQYPQMPARNDRPQPANTNNASINTTAVTPPQINNKSYDEIQAERGRATRGDDYRGNNTRIENRRDVTVQSSMPSPQMPVINNPTPVAAPNRTVDRPIERNERPVERMQERLIERGNERPIERPQASFAPRQESRPEPRPVEVRQAMPVVTAPVSTPPVSAPAAKTEKVEKPKDKYEESKLKRER
ncbi:hypothetical protein H8K35_03905 [Undibacterium sp. LX40W]|uniref:FecR protein domain-containing protein n=1 Tax=Undibacterium nitidum TaxID=2762298 RepID=A0A923HK00_9BURK|nr:MULTISPECIES: DUF6600 domain-containing protein [Undibacterium]MBC3880467.1 hypothetical protein [Undibacterium nitidum]MBC3890797.1 hypothetical protein [Undibacterium sp. LX40W]